MNPESSPRLSRKHARSKRARGKHRRRSDSIGRQSSGILAAQLVALVFGAIGTVLVARALGPSGRGALTVAGLAATFAFGLLAVGGGISNVYFVSRRDVEPQVAAGTSWALTGFTCIIGLPIFFVAAYYLRNSIFRGVAWPVLVLAGASIPALLIYRYLLTIAQGLRAVSLMAASMVATSVVTVALYVITLKVLNLGVFAALLSGVLGTLSAVIILTVFSEFGRPMYLRFDRAYLFRSFRFGIRGEIGNFLTTINYRFDAFFVTSYLGLAAAGRYTIAYTGAELLWQVPNALATILYPKVAAEKGAGSAQSTAELVRILLPLTILAAVLGCVMAPWLIPFVFGHSYDQAVSALIALTPGIAVFGIVKLIAAYLTGSGHPGITSISAGTSATITVIGDVILIPRLGIVGAGLASTIGYTVNGIILTIAYRSVSGLGVGSLFRPRAADWVMVRELAKRRKIRPIDPSAERMPS